MLLFFTCWYITTRGCHVPVIFAQSSNSCGTAFDEYDPLKIHSSTATRLFSDPLRTTSSAEIAVAPLQASLYPPSFRFVLLMDRTLLLFTPHDNEAAVAVLRNHLRSSKPTVQSTTLLDRSNSARTMSNLSSDGGDTDVGGQEVFLNHQVAKYLRSQSSRSLSEGQSSSRQLQGPGQDDYAMSHSQTGDVSMCRMNGSVTDGSVSVVEGVCRYDSLDGLGEQQFMSRPTGGVTSPRVSASAPGMSVLLL